MCQSVPLLHALRRPASSRFNQSPLPHSPRCRARKCRHNLLRCRSWDDQKTFTADLITYRAEPLLSKITSRAYISQPNTPINTTLRVWQTEYTDLTGDAWSTTVCPIPSQILFLKQLILNYLPLVLGRRNERKPHLGQPLIHCHCERESKRLPELGRHRKLHLK